MKRGFTLIEVLVGIALMIIVFLGIYGAFQLGLKVVGQSKARVTALAIANQKIEQIRNLAYQDIGTIGGIPPGIIPETESIFRNAFNFNLKTTVIYIDDPFDGAAPADTLVSDYKRAKVKVSWPGWFEGEIVLITDIAPKGIETEKGGGALRIVVLNASGEGVAQADIHIVNTQVIPAIDAFYQSDNSGNLILAGAPTSTEAYKISVSKAGFSQERTYGRDEIATPAKPHSSVFEAQLTEISFSIDQLSALSIQTTGTKGQGYPPVKNVTFHLGGAKIIGADSEGKPVYKYSQDHISSNAGRIDIANLEWDSYKFEVNKAQTGLDLIGLESPFGAETLQPLNLAPAASQEARLILKAENTLLVQVQDASTTDPIFGANARVYNDDLTYDNSKPTDAKGEAFFIPLEKAIYNLEIRAENYQTATAVKNVSGDSAETISLQKL